MFGPWYSELARLILVVASCFVLGVLLDQRLAIICAGLLAICFFYIYQGAKVLRQLREPAEEESGDQGTGVWGDIHALLSANRKKQAAVVKQLEDTLARYRQAIRALPEGAITLGPKDEIELFNETASRLLDLKEPDDIGRPITHLVRDPRFVRYMEERKFSDGLEIVHEDVPVSIRAVPYGDLGRKLLLVRDMTRLLKLERMRRDFVANVSHEMKSPLTVIKGYVESLIDEADRERYSVKKPLQQIDLQTDRMCHIVEDLLQLSNLETGAVTGEPAVLDVPGLIRSICVEAGEVSSGHEIISSIDDQLFIAGDFNELYSAFSNIVFNAITYTPDGGTISIMWKLDGEGSPVFAVSDTGIGIGPEHIPRLTERFYRVDQARSRELGGTGLGLAIVKHVLIRYKAELRIDSRLNEGSTFTCVFPKASARSRGRQASNS